MKQVRVSHMGQEGPQPIPPELALEARGCPCRVCILIRTTKVSTTETAVYKSVLPALAAARLPCFINKPESCSQHIKVNRDASRVGSASGPNR